MPPPINTEQYHGCPYRHWQEAELRRELARPRISLAGGPLDRVVLTSIETEAIVEKAKKSFYTAACHEHFKVLHPNSREESLFSTPLMYFIASRNYSNERKAARSALQQNQGPQPMLLDTNQPS